MSLGVGRYCGRATRFPRVSGDEPYMPTLKALVDGFSPRERG